MSGSRAQLHEYTVQECRKESIVLAKCSPFALAHVITTCAVHCHSNMPQWTVNRMLLLTIMAAVYKMKNAVDIVSDSIQLKAIALFIVFCSIVE